MRFGIKPLADEFVRVFESPNPQSVFCASPGIARLSTGRLIATIDLYGPDAATLPGRKGKRYGGIVQGKVFTSDDRGKTWTHRTDFPFMHARPFVAGESLYVLGQAHDLMIIRSDDKGITWTEPACLTENENWHQAPCNVLYANGCVYLVMESRIYSVRGWNVNGIAPVLMRGKIIDDLTKKANWTFASKLAFRNVVSQEKLDFTGIPFFETPPEEAVDIAPGRSCSPVGWLESNVVQIVDPDHYWHDPDGKTFHIWMRAHTGGTGYAAIIKVVEEGACPGTGAMTTTHETVPSGKKVVYVPCPGGQMKFHVLYDEITMLYWLLSTQAIDSMTRADRLPSNRYNLPNNERRRLQLHFSKNMIDWCFAGLVCIGPAEQASRHYASMAIDGDDLHVLSRSGDAQIRNINPIRDAHDCNLITFHTIKDFRKLVY